MVTGCPSCALLTARLAAATARAEIATAYLASLRAATARTALQLAAVSALGGESPRAADR